MALLDTTVLIDLSRGQRSRAHGRAMSLVRQLLVAGDTLFTSRLNEAEFRVGQLRAANPAAEARRIDEVLDILVILDFDAAAARHFAQVQAALLDKGTPAGEIDVLVAAVALRNGQPLATRNPGHFAEVSGLTVLPY